jgi:hypothetical protein
MEPDLILDIFNGDAFSSTALTSSINVVPNTYGRIRELGVFREEGVPTTSVAIAIENGTLNLLPMRQRGGPPSVGTSARANLRPFIIPHIPHDDAVLALDVQNRIALRPSMALQTVQGEVNKKLITMRGKHAITLEHLRAYALQGLVVDYDGTVVTNYFTEFGITEKVVDFAFTTDTTDVLAKLREINGYIEDNLEGEVMTGIHCLASPEWMDALLSHPTITEAYKFYAQSQNPMTQDLRRRFVHGGIMFEEYRGAATKLNEDKSKTSRRFIPANTARFFPLGTQDTFVTYFGPADFIEAANTAPGVGEDAQVFVAPLERMKFGKGMEIHTESNPLPMVKRPKLLVKGTMS